MNKTWKILHLALLATMIGLGLLACKSTRSVIKQPIKAEGANYLFNKLKENEFSFDTFSAKFNVDMIIDKTNSSFKGQLRIRKDSLIWISLSPALGIEAARLMITEDSVKFINRINNTYFLGDYDLVNDFLETSIDFDILQAFIIGNDFQYYEIGEFKASIDSKEYKLLATERNKVKKYLKSQEIPQIFIQNIWLNPETFKITRIDLKELNKDNKKLDVFFSDFDNFENQLFPTRLNYLITSPETRIEVDVKFSKINLNGKVKFPFTIPRKFSRIV